MKVSVVVPAHNEAENLPMLLNRIKKVGCVHEVIVVDDGSCDKTYAVALNMGAKVLRNQKRKGKGYALRRGFAAASGDVLVMMDADLSHLPEDIPKLVRPLTLKEVGLVIASRVLGGSGDLTAVRAAGSTLITKFFNLLFGTRFTDIVNGFKAFRREVARDLTSNGFEIEVELVARCLWMGYKVVEVASYERARRYGRGKLKALQDGAKFLARVAYERVRTLRRPH